MHETWAHRADLAESAINDRHSARVWGLPRTNLAVVSWPPVSKEKVFVHWHYWWQAHYLDCLVDAAIRRRTKARHAIVNNTVRGIGLRQGGKLSSNKYYDDKAWMALALARAGKLKNVAVPKQLADLE